ncbi:NAD-dependent epimerase/dehydratase family protein [Mucilaginibacter aquaedulcis]|uniref:NAD-dependent epimerase/dehydratase family protein n=1 Tax=Mucilaginibacter aquaedulcis TaxID=1187081 RepID=UPI0025B2B5D5|nr:NAD-dependent epimerase/dehydratase family protein [Mucilaginibacter aquaedulcis]MDN3548955.1 NAD-dependent epimerase/dehydratase family protein [Mucilaginibacter aquaedulcis]
MKPVKILVIGACGQIGTELTAALRIRYGAASVIAADRFPALRDDASYYQLNVLDRDMLNHLICAEKVTQIYLLAAILSAVGEQDMKAAWELNMGGLLNVLRVAVLQGVEKVFWPSSIAVFGPGAPKHRCAQHDLTEPQTVYGISKRAGEHFCNYYFEQYGLDVRSIRYPGLISHSSKPGGGTTDYAVEIFHQAMTGNSYTCYLTEDTCLPMMYMPDAVRAAITLMEAPANRLRVRTAYNISAMSFAPCDLAEAIRRRVPGFGISYVPDRRQAIADTWPASTCDDLARSDWDWQPEFGLETMVEDMLDKLFPQVAEPAKSYVLDDNYFFTRVDEA